jgi:hypothetical protein
MEKMFRMCSWNLENSKATQFISGNKQSCISSIYFEHLFHPVNPGLILVLV